MHESVSSETAVPQSIAAWNAESQVSGWLAATPASMNRTPSADFTRLGPTGTGATRRIHSSHRATPRA